MHHCEKHDLPEVQVFVLLVTAEIPIVIVKFENDKYWREEYPNLRYYHHQNYVELVILHTDLEDFHLIHMYKIQDTFRKRLLSKCDFDRLKRVCDLIIVDVKAKTLFIQIVVQEWDNHSYGFAFRHCRNERQFDKPVPNKVVYAHYEYHFKHLDVHHSHHLPEKISFRLLYFEGSQEGDDG